MKTRATVIFGSVVRLIVFGLAVATFVAAQNLSFNPSGYYFPNVGDRSRVMWLEVSDYYKSGQKGPLYVSLRIGNEKRWIDFSQRSLKIVGNRIRFTTKGRGTTSYEFDGYFSPTKTEREGGMFEELGKRTSLSGMLRTRRGNKLIRSERIKFVYSVGD